MALVQTTVMAAMTANWQHSQKAAKSHARPILSLIISSYRTQNTNKWHKLEICDRQTDRQTDLLISSNMAVRSFAFFIAIDSTCPWNTRKFLDFVSTPIFSSAEEYSSNFTDCTTSHTQNHYYRYHYNYIYSYYITTATTTTTLNLTFLDHHSHCDNCILTMYSALVVVYTAYCAL